MKRWFIGGAFVLSSVVAILASSAEFSAGNDKVVKKVEPKKAPEIAPLEGKTETIKLFNGKNLDGWEGYEDLRFVIAGDDHAILDRPQICIAFPAVQIVAVE